MRNKMALNRNNGIEIRLLLGRRRNFERSNSCHFEVKKRIKYAEKRFNKQKL